MKKSLLILALALQTNASYSDQQVKVQEESIETLVETTYKHPRARKVGELMPQPIGERVSLMDMFRLNKITGARKMMGIVLGFDRNGDYIPEYEFMNRFCDSKSGVKTYAVYDIPNKKLYIDSSRNKHIDSIVEGIDNLENKRFPMIPIKCKKEKLLVSSELGGK